MSTRFHISHHIVESPQAGHVNQSSYPLKLHIAQYTPKSNPAPQDGDTTLVAAHATGLTKELYEPLFCSLLDASESTRLRQPFRIRAIWIADMAQMGYSADLNADRLGKHLNYFDHSRDLFHIINTFCASMPPPRVALGHSLGAVQLPFLCNMHPRLFDSVALIEPAMTDAPSIGGDKIRSALRAKPDWWPTRAEAERELRTNPVVKYWDTRVVNRLVDVAFVRTPNMIYPDKDGWTLRTSKQQELAVTDEGPTGIREENVQALRLMPFLEPAILLVFGSHSALTRGAMRRRIIKYSKPTRDTVDTCKDGSLRSTIIKPPEKIVQVSEMKGGHFLPFENPFALANILVQFFSSRGVSEPSNPPGIVVDSRQPPRVSIGKL